MEGTIVIVKHSRDAYGHQLCERCAHCNRQVVEFPFIQWQLSDHSLVFHPICASKFAMRLARDLYELDSQ